MNLLERYHALLILIKLKNTNNITVNFKKLSKKAVIPTYAHDTDAGMDMTAISKTVTDDYIEFDTGIAIELPSGYTGLLFPRSSNSKKDLLMCNSVGVVDEGYQNSIKFRFKRIPNPNKWVVITSWVKKLFGIESITSTIDYDPKEYSVGEKIGQLIIMPYPKVTLNEVDEFAPSERGMGGFGSTDKPTDSSEAVAETPKKETKRKPRKKK